MSFELSFSPEFFFNEGEPCDCGNWSDRPTSVWQAIVSMREDDRLNLAASAGIEPDGLTSETILDMVQATNTCSNLDSPVTVWIDPQGYHTLKVW